MALSTRWLARRWVPSPRQLPLVEAAVLVDFDRLALDSGVSVMFVSVYRMRQGQKFGSRIPDIGACIVLERRGRHVAFGSDFTVYAVAPLVREDLPTGYAQHRRLLVIAHEQLRDRPPGHCANASELVLVGKGVPSRGMVAILHGLVGDGVQVGAGVNDAVLADADDQVRFVLGCDGRNGAKLDRSMPLVVAALSSYYKGKGMPELPDVFTPQRLMHLWLTDLGALRMVKPVGPSAQHAVTLALLTTKIDYRHADLASYAMLRQDCRR